MQREQEERQKHMEEERKRIRKKKKDGSKSERSSNANACMLRKGHESKDLLSCISALCQVVYLGATVRVGVDTTPGLASHGTMEDGRQIMV